MELLKWALILIGHIGLWAFLFNRTHSTALIRSIRKLSEWLSILFVVVPTILVVVRMISKGTIEFEAVLPTEIERYYGWLSLGLGTLFVGAWVYRKVRFPLPKCVISTELEMIDTRKTIQNVDPPDFHGFLPVLLGKVPFNQALKISLQRMTFALDVPPEMDGLKICQLSDLHYTGQIGIEYFQRVIDEARKFRPDLIVITGDIVDETHCLDWIVPTLGRLNAGLGVYYVLGNHDRRVNDEPKLRSLLREAGLIQASSGWHDIEFRGTRIQLSGNALPWFNDGDQIEIPTDEVDLRILLCHSPDQFNWCRERQADLMFAGHTHGGQISLPVIGPVISPSWYGVTYASGTFQKGDMLMHVSRGLSGDEPIRIGSPPEIGLFTIRSKQNSGRA